MKEGQILNERYRIIQDLKRGAFGKTYRAEDELASNKTLCVVKQLQPSTSDPVILEEARRRFELEAATLQKLGNHDQIPQLLDHFEENQEFYLVQDFVDGQDLSREITHGKQWSEGQAVALLYDVLQVLEYIHEQNVIHRDIKPSNLIRRKSDHRIVVIDFGAVKEIETLVVSSGGQPSGSVVGTPGYMPIEHLGGRPRYNSDLYALGMTTIQALTGMTPLKLPRDPQTDEILWRNLVPVSDELAAILDRMVNSQYQERYQSATEVLEDLQSLHNEYRGLHRIGHILDKRYKIIGLLGEGEFSQTYLALDQLRTDNPRCVIKQLKLQSHEPYILREARSLFEAEAQVLYNLGKHNQIPELLGEFEENHEFHLVHEFVDGEDLNHEISRGKFTETQAIELLEEVLYILAFIHQQDVIHFDIKPSNLIRRSRDRKIVLIDFGAVKQITTLVLNYQGQLSITRVIGTPGYMPKEQQAGNPRVSNDIYALGMTVIHALTGMFPEELGQDVHTGEVGWQVHTQVSEGLAAILNKMVRSYFRARYESVEEVLNDLRSLKNLRQSPPPSLEESQHLPVASLVTHSISQIEGNGASAAKHGETLVASPTASSRVSQSPETSTPALVSLTESRTEAAVTEEGEKTESKEKEKEGTPNTPPLTVTSASTVSSLAPAVTATPAAQKTTRSRLLPFSFVILGGTLAILGIFLWSPVQFAYLINRCNALIDGEQPEEATVFCEQAIKVQPNNSEALKSQGDALSDLERYEAAVIAYDKALQQKPDFYPAWNNRGQVLYRLQRYREAAESHQKAISVAPNDIKSINGLGIALVGSGNFEGALAEFDKAIAIAPNDAQSWENKGLALEYLQRLPESRNAYEEAIAILDNQIRGNAKNWRSWFNRGRILVKLQRHQEALDSYQEALKLNPNSYQAWIGKGSTLFFLQRFDDALVAYDKAVAIRPKYYLPWHNRGTLLADGLQRYEDAITSYQKAVDLKPDFYPALRDQGQALMRLQKYDQAITYFDKAIKVNPNDHQSWGSRGIALTQLKRYDEAFAAFEKAISINPNDPLAWANQAWALGEAKRYDEAINAYNKAIEIKPDFQAAIEARKQLLGQLQAPANTYGN